MNFNDILSWLNEFIKVIQDPHVLIFAAAFFVGLVITLYIERVPNWAIPLINFVLGSCAGWILLSASTAEFAEKFKAALMGATLALAATGFHQLYEKTTEGVKGLFQKKQ